MKKLREGFTTGSCAAAASLACCLWQRDGVCPERVEICIPDGRTYAPEILPHDDGSCGVVKYSGDDPDITNGMEIVSKVEILSVPGTITFKAGDGVGVVTEPGLKIPVGGAAINPVPRKMIEEAVRSVYPESGAIVTISIPGGRETARNTFNPRLGIKGGLSILGTSGVVRPMSEEALKDSLYEELKMRVAQGKKSLVFTFGNQGEASMRALFPDSCIVQVSNEIGYMLDSARELGVKKLIIGGHPGKLTKIAAGIMQTHSHTADGRREAIITQLALMGADIGLIRDVYASVTTDAAEAHIKSAKMDAVWDQIAAAAFRYCTARVNGDIEISIVIADFQANVLGRFMKGDQ